MCHASKNHFGFIVGVSVAPAGVGGVDITIVTVETGLYCCWVLQTCHVTWYFLYCQNTKKVHLGYSSLKFRRSLKWFANYFHLFSIVITRWRCNVLPNPMHLSYNTYLPNFPKTLKTLSYLLSCARFLELFAFAEFVVIWFELNFAVLLHEFK